MSQNEESTGSSMLPGMRGEEEIKEKLIRFSSFLSPNLNVLYKKVKVSLRNKSIIYCQLLACHNSQVRLSQIAHSDSFSSILFYQEAPSSPSPQQLLQHPDTGSVPRLYPQTWPGTVQHIQIVAGTAWKINLLFSTVCLSGASAMLEFKKKQNPPKLLSPTLG